MKYYITRSPQHLHADDAVIYLFRAFVVSICLHDCDPKVEVEIDYGSINKGLSPLGKRVVYNVTQELQQHLLDNELNKSILRKLKELQDIPTEAKVTSPILPDNDYILIDRNLNMDLDNLSGVIVEREPTWVQNRKNGKFAAGKTLVEDFIVDERETSTEDIIEGILYSEVNEAELKATSYKTDAFKVTDRISVLLRDVCVTRP